MVSLPTFEHLWSKTAVDLFFFYNNIEKVGAELVLFSIQFEKAHVTADLIIIVCTLIDNSYEPISAGCLTGIVK